MAEYLAKLGAMAEVKLVVCACQSLISFKYVLLNHGVSLKSVKFGLLSTSLLTFLIKVLKARE